MEEHLNKGIKDIISTFPEVADILFNEYGIGCGACTEASCLLKDVVEIHHLPEEREQELMRRMAKVFYPDGDSETPAAGATPAPTAPEAVAPVEPEGAKYSPPIKRLVDEHFLIKRLLALIPKMTKSLDLESESDRLLILKGLDFIRSYADRFHHAKEEDILFKYTDEDSDMVKVIYEDHKNARNHVKAAAEALERKEEAEVIEHLNGYKELLTEHIKKEDEILYPWIDRKLSTAQVGEIFARFEEADSKLGKETPEEYERFVSKLEE